MVSHRRKSNRRTRRKIAKPSKNFVKKVNKILHANAEDKYQRTATGYTIQPVPLTGWAGLFSAGNVAINTPYTLLPSVIQGTGSWNRLGNKIKVKSLIVNFQLSLKPGDDSIPLLVRLLVLKNKAVQEATLIPSIVTPSSDLFNLGSGQFGGGFNRPCDMELRVNRKAYTVVNDRVMKLEKGTGLDPYTAAPPGTVVCVSSTSVHRFSVRIPCGTPLVYANEIATFPTNFAPFFVVQYTSANMDTPVPPYAPPGYLDRVLVHYDVHMDYEDC